jgi:DnaJ domain
LRIGTIFISVASEVLLSLFLFGSIFSLGSLLIYTSKRQSKYSDRSIETQKSSPVAMENWAGLKTSLACLLEDAPQTVLHGQFYELCTPLMTPFACILTSSWHQYYLQQLSKPGINYWEWRDKPESKNICQELSLLLDLPEPTEYAQKTLQFFLNRKNFRMQTLVLSAFKDWHDRAQKLLGKEYLEAIYKRCYGVEWHFIKETIDTLDDLVIHELEPWWRVLEIQPSASSLQVEQAYKRLVRTWHPDLNPHPLANQMTSRLNVAYEEYRSLRPQVSSSRDCRGAKNAPSPCSARGDREQKLDPNLWFNKLQGWLKPLFSRR